MHTAANRLAYILSQVCSDSLLSTATATSCVRRVVTSSWLGMSSTETLAESSAEENTRSRIASSSSPEPLEKPDLVQQILSGKVLANSEVMSQRLKMIRAEFQRFDGDTGSTDVQVALLTEKISNLAEHMKKHRKDFSSRKGLTGLLNKRRKLLQYLRKSDFDAYTVLLVRLKLKDNYSKQDRLTLMQTRKAKASK